jgi:hypothetical protein
MKLSTIVAAVATVTSLLGTAASASPAGATRQLSTLGYPVHHGHPVTFTVKGESVNGMYPGITKLMNIRVQNPYGFDLQVTQLAGKVTNTSRRTCGTTSLVADRFGGTLPIKLKAKQSKSIGSIPVRMPASVGNECAATTFTVLLYGTATKVNK